MKIEPITSSRPTNAQLGKGINQLHDCLEGLKDTHGKRLRTVERDVRDIKNALGVGEVKKKIVATQSPRAAWWRTFIATTSSITAVGVTFRAVQILWPPLKIAVLAWVHAMASGRL